MVTKNSLSAFVVLFPETRFNKSTEYRVVRKGDLAKIREGKLNVDSMPIHGSATAYETAVAECEAMNRRAEARAERRRVAVKTEVEGDE